MNTDVADLLHESIDRLTEGERLPERLADRAFRRHRQRRIALGAAGVTGTAMAAAAAVFVATAATNGAPQPGRGTIPAQTTAYVLGRTERALAAVERGNVIQEIRVAAHDSAFVMTSRMPLEFAPQAVFWTYRGQFRDEGFTGSGKPVFNVSAVYRPAGQQRRARATAVDYAERTWSRATVHTLFALPPPIHGKCRADLPAPTGQQVNWPAKIREVLSCGQYRVTGRQWIGGIHTIRIATARPPGGVHQVFWVNPATYLPVRAVWAWPAGNPTTRLSGDFQWLVPTKARVAALRVTVPAGFRRAHPLHDMPNVSFILTLPGAHRRGTAR